MPMKIAGRTVSLLSLVSMFACAETTTTTPDPGAGRGTTPGEATPAACTGTGTGSVALVVRGLPAGVDAKVTVTGAGSATPATTSTTLADLAAGSYTITAERVARPDPIVRALYDAKVDVATFCVDGARTQTVAVTYAEIATSNKLWSTNQNSTSADLVAFGAAGLGTSGSPAASVAVKGPVGRSIAFDRDGHMWTVGGTTADAPIARFAVADLAASGAKTPDRAITPELDGCLPGPSTIAFDPSGALWAAIPCSDRVLRIDPENLAATRTFTPAPNDFARTNLHGPRGIAFDKDGSMWVSDATRIHRFAAASLAAGQPHTTTFAIAATTSAAADLPPDALAFDADGNLWTTSFGGNVIFKLTPANLAAVGELKEVVPSVILTVGLGALLESLAFDESGSLWLTYSQGKVARIARTQLGTSTNAGAPTVPEGITTSADLGYAGGLAFFPAASALPLFSRF